ncbi:hypothetical protein BDL97_14G030800 [Sphagnum fallax]|nr:hypothetical protein BDL97_14G030800 [Sphagnum fallax]
MMRYSTRGLITTSISLRSSTSRQWSAVAVVIWAMLMTQACLMGVARVEAGRVAAGGLSINNHGVAKFVTQTVLFQQNYQAFSDDNHARVSAGGQQVQLVLDQQAAAGFGSKSKYLFGDIGMHIKLVPGYSAGTVTSFYLSSNGATHDELDFEFLGNITGQPYILQTNVYAHGVGNREQRINLWFDPTADFHYYSVNWNQNYVMFLVDNVPIRVFKNNQNLGVPYLNSQAMAVYTSLWDGSQWATEGGRVKIDWQYAPFIATYEGFNVDGCVVQNNNNLAGCAVASSNKWAQAPALTWHQTNQLKWGIVFFNFVK